MATFFKFEQFAEDLGTGVHDLNADTLKVYLTNATPSASLDAVKADLAEITQENGYDGPADILNAFSQASGTGTLTGTDKTWTSTGAGFGPFQYVPLYNDTPVAPADPLVGAWDYGSAITPAGGETFTADFGASILTIA